MDIRCHLTTRRLDIFSFLNRKYINPSVGCFIVRLPEGSSLQFPAIIGPLTVVSGFKPSYSHLQLGVSSRGH